MKPLQIWLPYFNEALSDSALRRDLERAQKEWTGEVTIWLDPSWGKPCRWMTPGGTGIELAIPAETSNRIDIYHLGSNGHIHGNQNALRFDGPCQKNILRDFLNCLTGDEEHRLEIVAPPKELTMRFPKISGDSIVYIDKAFSYTAGGTGRLKLTGDRSFETTFASPGEMPVVSPSEESSERYGEMKRIDYLDDEERIPIFTSEKDPDVRSILTLHRWPGALEGLFPFGGGPDAILTLIRVKAVAVMSDTQPEKALHDALSYSARYLSEGTGMRLDTWLYPLINELGPDGALTELEGVYDLAFSSMKAAFSSEKFYEEMSRRVVIRRALGVAGLFWALLIDELEAARVFRRCERCTRFIQGRKGKRFCGKTDNTQCWRERRAESRRRERLRLRTS